MMTIIIFLVIAHALSVWYLCNKINDLETDLSRQRHWFNKLADKIWHHGIFTDSKGNSVGYDANEVGKHWEDYRTIVKEFLK